MNKLPLFLLALLSPVFLFGQENKIEKARQKLNKYTSVSYETTAFYPNPETEELNSFSSTYIINNHASDNFDFYCKTDDSEEIYKNEVYYSINNTDKIIYQYKEKDNQRDRIQNSRLVQYGPTFLLGHAWKYQNEILISGINHSHYSHIKDTREYEGKTIKIEFHIYISPNHTIARFERKSSVDDKVGQTVTYYFSNYKFSKKKINYRSLPHNYALKYFENTEVDLLQAGLQAPAFDAIDINGNKLSEKVYLGNQTLLLFSSTNCGASKIVSDFINSESFNLQNDCKLINVYASESKQNIEKYFKGKATFFPIIVNHKEIEDKYQVSGYPVLYFINENGTISGTFEGYEPVIQFLRSKSTKRG